jgi:hypothetical protein
MALTQNSITWKPKQMFITMKGTNENRINFTKLNNNLSGLTLSKFYGKMYTMISNNCSYCIYSFYLFSPSVLKQKFDKDLFTSIIYAYRSCTGCIYSFLNLFSSALKGWSPFSIAMRSASVGSGSGISNLTKQINENINYIKLYKKKSMSLFACQHDQENTVKNYSINIYIHISPY